MAPLVATTLALARRYRPILRLVRQAEACGYGEPYVPIDVDLLLRKPDRRAPRALAKR